MVCFDLKKNTFFMGINSKTKRFFFRVKKLNAAEFKMLIIFLPHSFLFMSLCRSVVLSFIFAALSANKLVVAKRNQTQFNLISLLTRSKVKGLATVHH